MLCICDKVRRGWHAAFRPLSKFLDPPPPLTTLGQETRRAYSNSPSTTWGWRPLWKTDTYSPHRQWRRTLTNLKVGEGRTKTIFFVVSLHIFVPTSTSLGERFRDGQYSLVSFLFAVLLLTVPPCPVIFVKVGGGARDHRALWSRHHCWSYRTSNESLRTNRW